MIGISQATFSNVCKLLYFESNFTEFVLKGLINNELALVQIMAWCQRGTKPLSESIMASFIDTYMHHFASIS